jgi:CBS domain-containing protein
MDVELIEIREFLASHPPFDQLTDEALDRLPKELTIRYLRRGTPFPPQDAECACLYIVRKGAIELRNTSDELVAKFGEGDVYSSACLPHDPARNLIGAAVEDSLFYLLPCDRLQTLRDADQEFNDYFTQSISTRLRRAREIQQDSPRAGGNLMTVEISALTGRSPVTAPPTTTIQEAAQLMTRERVSALLITDDRLLVGIITDRDLRSRCIANGISCTQPVSEIMTRNLHKVTPDTPAFEALINMTRYNIHHLPVVGRDGVLGVVSTTDLIRYQSANAIYSVGSVRKCQSVSELVQASAELPELQVQLIAAGASAYQLGQAISAVTDAITRRLIELAETQFGPAPVSYVWVAGGSQGRREQTVHSDQDNALILSDDYQPHLHAYYFEQLAQFVTDGLNACGYYNCPGGIMASNPLWRQPWQTWRKYFDDWIMRVDRKSAMLATNFFDMRAIHGDEMLFARLHAEVLHQARDNKIFLAYMATNALTTRPPLGFFRNFVLISDGDHANSFDLKLRGILPVINLARIYALTAGIPEINTVERLKAAADAHSLSQEGADNLEDAFEFIGTLRARHQAQQIKAGEKPDNYVTPEELSTLERNHLKDAFSAISALQTAMAQRYQTGRFY